MLLLDNEQFSKIKFSFFFSWSLFFYLNIFSLANRILLKFKINKQIIFKRILLKQIFYFYLNYFMTTYSKMLLSKCNILHVSPYLKTIVLLLMVHHEVQHLSLWNLLTKNTVKEYIANFMYTNPSMPVGNNLLDFKLLTRIFYWKLFLAEFLNLWHLKKWLSF